MGSRSDAPPSCHRNLHFAHLGQPVGSRIRDCPSPNEVHLAIFHADHYRVQEDLRFLCAGSYVESETGRVVRQLERRDPLRAQILCNDTFPALEKREDKSPGCTIEESEIHVRKAVFEVRLTLPG